MRDSDDDFLGFDEGPPFPTMITIAGIAWICFGSLAVVGGLISLIGALGAPEAAARGREGAAGAYQAGKVCGAVFVGAIGAAFILVGIQSVRGTAKDTLGNSIGAIILGVLYLGIGALSLALAAGRLGAGDILGTSLILLLALGLIGSGIIGLVGRNDYKAWRREHRPHTRPREER